MRGFLRGMVLIVLLAPSWAATPALTLGQELPEYTGESVYVLSGEVSSTYEGLKATIDRVERASPRSYAVVVVDSLPSGIPSARAYLDRILDRWPAQAIRNSRPLDLDQLVLAVLVLDDRRIAVNVGNELERRFGLQDESITTSLVEPYFLPSARQDQLVRGLERLVEGTEEWVAQREGSAKSSNSQPPANKQPQDASISSPQESTSPATVPSRTDDDSRSREETTSAPVPRTAAPGRTNVLLWVVGIGMGLAVALAYLVHRWKKRGVSRDLAAYKEQVVRLSDRIDALKERHRMLTHLDPDFKQPMQGQTRALYDRAGSSIEKFRERWLGLMDAWERAEELLKSEKPFLLGKLRKASAVLQAAGAPSELESLEKESAAPLDQLEQAHQAANEMRHASDADRHSAIEAIANVQQVRLPTGPYQPSLDESAALVGAADATMEFDPIAAQQSLTEARRKLSDVAAWAKTIVERLRSADSAEDRIAEVDSLARTRRAEGYLLIEEGGNPDPHLEVARRELSKTREALEGADAEQAQTATAIAVKSADEARQVIERQVEAKAFVEQESPKIRTQVSAARDRLFEASRDEAELHREFAPESWRTVADNAADTQLRLASAEEALTAADSAARGDIQNYLIARQSVEQAQSSSTEAGQLMAALHGRLVELRSLRDKCQAELSQARTAAVRVEQFLRSHSADRPRATQRLHSAQGVLEQLLHEAGRTQVDWVQIASHLGEVEADLRRAEEQAREDIRLADQAAAEIMETEQQLRSWRGATHFGFSPDLSAAEAQLAQARNRLAGQAYEEAIALANSAETAARNAQHAAAARARAHQAELERQRRARAAATISPAATIGSTPFQSIQGAGPSSTSHSKGTAETSWSKGTSESGW